MHFSPAHFSTQSGALAFFINVRVWEEKKPFQPIERFVLCSTGIHFVRVLRRKKKGKAYPKMESKLNPDCVIGDCAMFGGLDATSTLRNLL